MRRLQLKAVSMRVQKKEQSNKALRTLNFNLGVRVNSDAFTKLRSIFLKYEPHRDRDFFSSIVHW